MSKFVCVSKYNQTAYVGDTLEEAFKAFQDDTNDDINEAIFYPLGDELHVELKLIPVPPVEKLVVSKKGSLPK